MAVSFKCKTKSTTNLKKKWSKKNKNKKNIYKKNSNEHACKYQTLIFFNWDFKKTEK